MNEPDQANEEQESKPSKGKKALKIILIIFGVFFVLLIIAIVIMWFALRAAPVPENIEIQFSEDSSNTTDTSDVNILNDQFNDPMFDDMDFGDDISDSLAPEDDTLEISV
ncbi:MAG: flagellar basal body-associated protein FliL [Parvicellaceae bacterium]|jgi:flagellar basal body-associated protein FliL